MYPEEQKKFKGPVYLHLVRGGGQAWIFLYPLGLLPVCLGFSWWKVSPSLWLWNLLGHWMGCLSGHTSGHRRVVNWWSPAVSWWGRMLDRHGTLSEGALGTSGRGLGYRCSNLTSGRAVDHNILLPRLEHTICIKCIVLLWFESCRIDLHLFVSMFSSHSKVICSVPQGCVMGPFLLTFYILSLGSIFRRHITNFIAMQMIPSFLYPWSQM